MMSQQPSELTGREIQVGALFRAAVQRHDLRRNPRRQEMRHRLARIPDMPPLVLQDRSDHLPGYEVAAFAQAST